MKYFLFFTKNKTWQKCLDNRQNFISIYNYPRAQRSYIAKQEPCLQAETGAQLPLAQGVYTAAGKENSPRFVETRGSKTDVSCSILTETFSNAEKLLITRVVFQTRCGVKNNILWYHRSPLSETLVVFHCSQLCQQYDNTVTGLLITLYLTSL